MCSHYQQLKDRDRYIRRFGVPPPEELDKFDIWPGYNGSFIRRHQHAGVGDDVVPRQEALVGSFGLIPHWASDTTISRHTYNARTETVAGKPSFREAWRKAQHCIIPAEAFFEPDWRTGKAVPTRICLADGEPMGLAGLWSCWKSPKGLVHSYTMLTVNADDNSLLRQLHKPTDEKRMVVILPPKRYQDWLEAAPDTSMGFMRAFPADLLTALPATPASTSQIS